MPGPRSIGAPPPATIPGFRYYHVQPAAIYPEAVFWNVRYLQQEETTWIMKHGVNKEVEYGR